MGNPTETCFQLGTDGKTMQMVERSVNLPNIRVGSDLYWRYLKGGRGMWEGAEGSPSAGEW